MIPSNFRKFVALTLVAIFLSLSVNSAFSLAHQFEEAAGFHATETSGHCPSCPAAPHQDTEHEHFSCDHHSPLSAPEHAGYRVPAPVLISSGLYEAFQAIPEVYLDRFIPPQNLV